MPAANIISICIFVLVIARGLNAPGFAQSAATNAASSKTPTTAAQRSFAQRSAPPSPAKRNVILITIDTLRADHVGCYGAKTVRTPTLDALARDGVVFERAISQVPLTWPSHAVILTGTYPFQNGVRDFTGQPLAPQFRSVAQAFKQAGYATGAVISAFVLDKSWGLGRGFDSYDDAFSAKTFVEKDIDLVDRPAGESVDHAIAWLNRTVNRPFFLWLHLYDPHSPYESREPYRTEYRDHPYDGAIAYADHELGRLVAWLKQNHIYDSSLIVALSDHGESLGEHGEDEHGFFVYNATVHIPLIVKPPAGSGISAGRRSETVETAAVAPTLLGLAGAGTAQDIRRQFKSDSLFNKERTDVELNQAKAYSETYYPFSSFGWSPLRALENDRFHFIDAPNPELYDLIADPAETHNLAAEETATVAAFREQLAALAAPKQQARSVTGTEATAEKLNPDAPDKLRALGYLGFHAAVTEDSTADPHGLADPKNKLWELNAILQAGDAFKLHQDDQAEGLLHQVQEKDPQIYVIPFMLGESALRQRKWQDAADDMQRCLELNPMFDSAMTGLARALDALGRSEEARQWLTKALQANPENYRAWYQLGTLDAKDNPGAGLANYQHAIAVQPNFSPGQRETGMALFQQKNYVGAAAHLEKAIALGLSDARLHNFLGICYAQTGRMALAAREHRRAIELDPKLAEAHLNLAYAYEHMGKMSEAKAEYEKACDLEAKFCAFAPK
jgi:choline-sulfatase